MATMRLPGTLVDVGIADERTAGVLAAIGYTARAKSLRQLMAAGDALGAAIIAMHEPISGFGGPILECSPDLHMELFEMLIRLRAAADRYAEEQILRAASDGALKLAMAPAARTAP